MMLLQTGSAMNCSSVGGRDGDQSGMDLICTLELEKFYEHEDFQFGKEITIHRLEN